MSGTAAAGAAKALPMPLKPLVTPADKPKISSVTYSAPSGLTPGSPISVDLIGTPTAMATVEITGFISPVRMKERSPGKYWALLTVPMNKTLRNGALVGRLVLNGASAAPVQASKLITTAQSGNATVQPRQAKTIIPPSVIPVVTKAKPVAPPVEAPRPVIPAVVAKAESVPPPKEAPVTTPVAVKSEPQSQAKSIAPIIILSPTNGATIRNAIIVDGTAEPNSKVMVVTTYNNGLNGLLRLSGRVGSQLAAVGKNGVFSIAPMPLEGPLATSGLIFTVKAYYAEESSHEAVSVVVSGGRS